MSSLAARRIEHWDRISRQRPLTDLESLELERAIRIEQRGIIRGQAKGPPPKKGREC